MARAIPQLSLPLVTEAAAAAPAAVAAEANLLRLSMVVERLSLLLSIGGVRSDELRKICASLTRSIDFALKNNIVPPTASCLPSLVKQVYGHRNDNGLQSVITVLMISVKNACKNRWFEAADSDELLKLANELCSSFCMSMSFTTEVNNVLNTMSKIISRFCPQLKLGRLLVSFEAKPGYDILMADIHLQKYMSPEEKMRLFVVQTDDLMTSSCLISPQQVSFLVNGKGVEKRTNVSQDSGPQLPTDITKMLRYGTNIIQAVGYFGGNYIISVASTSEIPSPNYLVLKDCVQPVAALASDSEISEGSSKISLNCPMSFRRINIPVKGHLCKHRQCFDYENFMEMNSRIPSWRCPSCNQPTSFIDLCIDQNMVKILQNVGDGITDVIIASDGSWEVVAEDNGDRGESHKRTLAEQQDCEIGNENAISNDVADIVDLTMVEDEGSEKDTYETEDRKPFKDSQVFPVTEFSFGQPPAHSAIVSTQGLSNCRRDDIWPGTSLTASFSNEPSIPAVTLDMRRIGTLESLIPNFVLNPVITDAVSPSVGQDNLPVHLMLNQSVSNSQNVTQIGQLSGNMQIQQSMFGNSSINSETERLPIPRNVSRVPIAVQALPVQSQASSSFQRLFPNAYNSSSNIPASSISASHATIPSMTASASNLMSSNIENWEQGRQCSLNSTLQQVVGLPAPTQANMRFPSDQQNTSAHRASQQPSSDHQAFHHQLQYPRGNQTISQCTSVPQSSCSPSVQAQQASQNAVGLALGNPANHQNQTLIAQRAAHVARLYSTVPYVSTAGSSLPLAADSVRLIGVERNMVGGPLMASRAEGLPELPSEHNWRPTGRMRGSLTGSAYSAALNHYVAQSSQPVSTRPPDRRTVASSELLPVLISNNVNAHESLVPQSNRR